jgi:tetratricopeptide (TPR) repeat protein
MHHSSEKDTRKRRFFRILSAILPKSKEWGEKLSAETERMSDWMDAEAHADRAFELYERGRWAEAESELRKALSLNPDQPEWYFNLGLTLEAAGRDADALAAYERAIDLMPDQPEPMIAAGIVSNRLDRYSDAIRFFDRALRLDQTNEAAYCHKIESHLRLGDHDEAETTFYLAQHALPEPSAHCLSAIADSLIDRGEYARAGWCLREALRHEPSLPRLRGRLGNVYAALGQPQRALQLYLRELRDDPGNVDTLLDFGELLVEFGRMPEAEEKFRRVLELEPANADARHRLGEIAMHMCRYERAQLEFELVLKLEPDFPGIRPSLAEAMLRRGRLKEARRTLREEFDLLMELEERVKSGSTGQMIDSTVDDIVCHHTTTSLIRLGDLLLEAKMPREAGTVFERCCRKPRFLARKMRLLVWRKLALARFRAGDRAGGAAMSRRVLRHHPHCISSIHNLGLAALEEGRITVAAGWIKRGLKIDRHDDGLRQLRMRLWLAAAQQGMRKLLFWRSA